jgi:hypothetical protein
MHRLINTKIMSTTFGVKVPSLYEEDEFEILEVAFRSRYVRWKNGVAQLLPDETEVIAMDNSAQGIYTIGDIRKAISGNDA